MFFLLWVFLRLFFYVGLFVWGVKSASITYKNMAILVAIGIVSGWLGVFIALGEETEKIFTEEAARGLAMFLILRATIIKAAIYFIGFGIGWFRRRRKKANNARDTFS